MNIKNTGLALALIASAASAMGVPAFAKARNETITVTGDFADQRITAPARHTAQGDQVYLPHGAWVYCAGDCKKALKDATFDFWTIQEENAG
jgi:hypothetical protein